MCLRQRAKNSFHKLPDPSSITRVCVSFSLSCTGKHLSEWLFDLQASESSAERSLLTGLIRVFERTDFDDGGGGDDDATLAGDSSSRKQHLTHDHLLPLMLFLVAGFIIIINYITSASQPADLMARASRERARAHSTQVIFFVGPSAPPDIGAPKPRGCCLFVAVGATAVVVVVAAASVASRRLATQ